MIICPIRFVGPGLSSLGLFCIERLVAVQFLICRCFDVGIAGIRFCSRVRRSKEFGGLFIVGLMCRAQEVFRCCGGLVTAAEEDTVDGKSGKLVPDRWDIRDFRHFLCANVEAANEEHHNQNR